MKIFVPLSREFGEQPLDSLLRKEAVHRTRLAVLGDEHPLQFAHGRVDPVTLDVAIPPTTCPGWFTVCNKR